MCVCVCVCDSGLGMLRTRIPKEGSFVCRKVVRGRVVETLKLNSILFLLIKRYRWCWSHLEEYIHRFLYWDFWKATKYTLSLFQPVTKNCHSQVYLVWHSYKVIECSLTVISFQQVTPERAPPADCIKGKKLIIYLHEIFLEL